MKTKKCWKCKKIKSISEFYKNRYKTDGFASQCKICQVPFGKKYQKGDKFRLVQKRYKQSKKGKKVVSSYGRNLYKRHPEKILARNAVRYAIRTGKLKPPAMCQCTYCHSGAQQYHHHSYDKKDRLNVIPVCKLCHKVIHST